MIEKEKITIIKSYLKRLTKMYDYIDPEFIKFNYKAFNSVFYGNSKLCSPKYIKVGKKVNKKMKYGIVKNIFYYGEPVLKNKTDFDYNINAWLKPILPCVFDEISVTNKGLGCDCKTIWLDMKFVYGDIVFTLKNDNCQDMIKEFAKTFDSKSTERELA